jgi:predicted phosphate transport protein (TIGR00153 family)
MSILQPREDRFYRLFDDAVANVRKGAELLLALLQDYTNVVEKAKVIKEVEHTGDELTHEIHELLNKVFVTPMDREDIADIASALDDVLDRVEATADDFVLCDIQEPMPPAVEMANIIVQATEKMQEAFAALRHINKDRALMRERLTEIHTLENTGDTIHRNALHAMFRQPDPIQIIKWKQVYDHMEKAIDSCEDVADVLQGVLLKYA